MKYTEEELKYFRVIYHKRRSQRIALFWVTIIALIIVGIVIMPLMDNLGIQRLVWAPIAYVLIFGIIVATSYIWKCPACKGNLGDVFRSRYCPKCGLNFYDKILKH